MPVHPETRCLACNNEQCQEPAGTQREHYVRDPSEQVFTRLVVGSSPASDFLWSSTTPMSSPLPDPQSAPSAPITMSPPDEFPDLLTALHRDGYLGGSPLDSDYPFSPNDSSSDGHLDFSLPTDATWHASLVPPVSSTPFRSPPEYLGDTQTRLADPRGILTNGRPERHSSSPGSGSHPSPDWQAAITHMTPGQASLFQALFSLARPEDDIPSNSNATHLPATCSSVSFPTFLHDDAVVEDEDEDNRHDPEGVARILCDIPGMDSSVQSNTLAFVLESYARWFTLTVFDPLRIVHQAKQNIIRQFSRSESDRMRIILVANAFRELGRTLEPCPKGLSIISALRACIHNGIALFNSNEPSSIRELDMRDASMALENMLEVILVHFYSTTLPTIIRLMQDAAPVFRRACSEPFNQLPNLPNILLEPELHKRYFAVIDVALSVTAARPMFFRYDVTHPPDFFDQRLPSDYGLEWLHGIPDKFVVLFAKINALREDFGTNVDPQVVAEIETHVLEATLYSMSEDPLLKVSRLVVQESWRQATLIYLYMVLCGAHAKDPRIELALKKFMQIIESLQAGRHPDAFIFIAMIVAGVAAHKPTDRDKLRRRMLGTRECSVIGIVGNDSVRVLDDLWARMDEERRAAVWDDFRMSNERIVAV